MVGLNRYHPETMGFGKEGGRYPVFLQDKYTNIENLNKAYGSNYSSFIEVYPKPESQSGVESARVVKDYHDFYCNGRAYNNNLTL